MLEYKVDHRANAKLHDLYVGYAMEELVVINEAVERLSEFSRVHASILAGALIEKKNEFILEDAAWAEASIRLETGLNAPDSYVQMMHGAIEKPSEPVDF